MKSIETLKAEHQNILKLISILRAMCLRVLGGDKFDVDELKLASKFISGYGDRIHHGKEEKILFDQMLINLGPLAEKLINTGMMIEHDLGRYYNMSLLESVEAYESDPCDENALDIIGYAMAYSDLLKRHIDKEDSAVYPFAQRSLDRETIDLVEANSEKLDEENAVETKEYLEILDKLSYYIK